MISGNYKRAVIYLMTHSTPEDGGYWVCMDGSTGMGGSLEVAKVSIVFIAY